MGRLTVLKQIAADLASQFGPDCEVVIHDLKTSEPEHSIVYIVNGHVTNRDIGDGPSNAVFDAIRNQEKGATPEDHTGYLMKTAGAQWYSKDLRPAGFFAILDSGVKPAFRIVCIQ